jgi:hypothetical protein
VEEHDDLIRRLRDFGSRPVDPVVASRHLTGLARPASRSPWRGRLKVGAAFAAGLLLGGAGLAHADALPDPAQQAAHTALGKVGINVPPGHQRYNDPAVCPGGPYRNHGQYVRTHKDDPNAGRSPCGKPLKSAKGGAKGKEKDRRPANADKDHEKDEATDPQEQEREQEERGGGPNGPSPTTTTESTLAPTTTSSSPSTTTSTTAP